MVNDCRSDVSPVNNSDSDSEQYSAVVLELQYSRIKDIHKTVDLQYVSFL